MRQPTPSDDSVKCRSSLRSSFATSAAMKCASERSIQNQTGHWSLTTLRRYIATYRCLGKTRLLLRL